MNANQFLCTSGPATPLKLIQQSDQLILAVDDQTGQAVLCPYPPFLEALAQNFGPLCYK
ncbi:MAG: hypothetical protein ACOYXO_02455 [Chloroflexota bacterium]